MNIPTRRVAWIAAAGALAVALPLAAANDEVPYPKDYRQWTYVKSMQHPAGYVFSSYRRRCLARC